MADKKISRDDISKMLSQWDGINVKTVRPSGDQKPTFTATDKHEMEMDYDGVKYHFKGLAYEKAGRMCGIPATYLAKVPTALMEPHFNYWFREFPFTHMVFDEGNGHNVITLSRTKNFSIAKPRDFFEIFDDEVRKISKDVSYDRVFADPEYVGYSIVTDRGQNMGTPKKNDIINAGFKVAMDPLGETPLTVSLYTLRLVCTNGATAVKDVVKLRMNKVDNLEEWARGCIGNILEASVEEFGRIKALKDVKVENLGELLIGLFDKVKLTGELREALTNSFIDEEIPTMYEFFNHITAYANRFTAIEDYKLVSSLQVAAGFVSAHEFCPTCHHCVR